MTATFAVTSSTSEEESKAKESSSSAVDLAVNSYSSSPEQTMMSLSSLKIFANNSKAEEYLKDSLKASLEKDREDKGDTEMKEEPVDE